MEKNQDRLKIAIPFDEKEAYQFKDFMKQTGRKAGPWVRTLILRAISDEVTIRTGKTQIDFEAMKEAQSAR